MNLASKPEKQQKTIASCLKQETDINYELLLVDDASTDSTPKILAQYENEKIRVITAWRYPGKSPIRGPIPIPEEILEELGEESNY